MHHLSWGFWFGSLSLCPPARAAGPLAPCAEPPLPPPLRTQRPTSACPANQACARATQLQLEGGELHAGAKPSAAIQGYKLLDTLVFRDCMRAPKLPVDCTDTIPQSHRLAEVGRAAGGHRAHRPCSSQSRLPRTTSSVF